MQETCGVQQEKVYLTLLLCIIIIILTIISNFMVLLNCIDVRTYTK